MLTHIQLFSIPVTDQDRAKAFYVEALGWTLVNDQQMGPQRWVQVRPPAGQTSMTLVTWFDSMPAGSLKGVVVETDDLAGDIAALSSRGVQIASEVQTAPWGRWTTFADPDGNEFVLQTTASGD